MQKYGKIARIYSNGGSLASSSLGELIGKKRRGNGPRAHGLTPRRPNFNYNRHNTRVRGVNLKKFEALAKKWSEGELLVAKEIIQMVTQNKNIANEDISALVPRKFAQSGKILPSKENPSKMGRGVNAKTVISIILRLEKAGVLKNINP